MSKEDRDDSECVCSVGMKLTWDINDPKLPQDTKQFDPFQEWTDGYVRFIYNGEDKNAQRHLSGWAMRNTNNHNCQILKKSCLGVVVCSRNCSLQDGTKLTLRPAICDKARQKQQKKLCPSCNSSLELLACRGHSGYPVTNFWRIDGKAIFFQSKGVHDHPRPESKAETEARRSAVKRRITSPPFTPKRRLLDTEGRYELGSSLLSCDPGTDRFSIMESQFPLQGQHFPAFQSPEPYYTSHHALGEQKARDPRLYVTARPGCHGYDFPYLGGYPENTADPRTFGTSCSSSSSAPPLCSSSSSSYDPQGSGVKPPPPPPHHPHHPGWKQLLKSGAPYGELPGTAANHHYYTPEYSCRYPAHPATNPPGGPAALQTIITTTTKVSYQHCPKPPSYQACPTAPGCPSASSASSKPPCSSSLLDEASSSSPYSTEMKMTSPEMKMTSSSDDSGSGVIKSLSFQPENVSTKPERVEPYDYRYSYPNYRYDEY